MHYKFYRKNIVKFIIDACLIHSIKYKYKTHLQNA